LISTDQRSPLYRSHERDPEQVKHNRNESPEKRPLVFRGVRSQVPTKRERPQPENDQADCDAENTVISFRSGNEGKDRAESNAKAAEAEIDIEEHFRCERRSDFRLLLLPASAFPTI
jgi:hypothetical protein